MPENHRWNCACAGVHVTGELVAAAVSTGSLRSSRRRERATLGSHAVSPRHRFHNSMAIATLLARWGCKRVNWARLGVDRARKNRAGESAKIQL